MLDRMIRPSADRVYSITRARAVLAAVLAIVVCVGSACGGDDEEGGSRDSLRGTADYSISTAKLDRELACKGGKEQLSGEGEHDPVLLVHGTSVTREQNWGWNYWDALPDLGYEVCWVQLPDLAFGDIQTASEYVARAVEVMHERTGENIDVLGHSQGGLEPRWVIKWFPAGAFVDDYIALATPNHGASTFDKPPADEREIEAGWQMRTNSNFLTALNRGDETPGPIDYTSIYSKTDELIQPVGTQDVKGGTNLLLQDLCPGRRVDHGGIAGDDVTYRLVIDALTNTGTANPDRAKVKCARDAFPGVGKPPQFGPPPKGIDPHFAEREPPLKPYARG
jgi:triacylglycerol lipase